MQNGATMREGKNADDRAADTTTTESKSNGRRAYESPRIERRIPIASNTLQPTSGTEDIFGPGEE
ncbi:Hypothetical protein I5071_24810 [Sandaracinus amylolyticus]|nr:Hypothetical protein I5071_24810 [Sandaracinus amylolyticus]